MRTLRRSDRQIRSGFAAAPAARPSAGISRLRFATPSADQHAEQERPSPARSGRSRSRRAPTRSRPRPSPGRSRTPTSATTATRATPENRETVRPTSSGGAPAARAGARPTGTAAASIARPPSQRLIAATWTTSAGKSSACGLWVRACPASAGETSSDAIGSITSAISSGLTGRFSDVPVSSAAGQRRHAAAAAATRRIAPSSAHAHGAHDHQRAEARVDDLVEHVGVQASRERGAGRRGRLERQREQAREHADDDGDADQQPEPPVERRGRLQPAPPRLPPAAGQRGPPGPDEEEQGPDGEPDRGVAEPAVWPRRRSRWRVPVPAWPGSGGDRPAARRADREDDAARDRIRVGGDDAVGRRVGALRQVRLQRDRQRVALARRPEGRAGLHLGALDVEDADDAEAGLDRLVEVEGDARRLPLRGRLPRRARCARASRAPTPLAGTASARTAATTSAPPAAPADLAPRSRLTTANRLLRARPGPAARPRRRTRPGCGSAAGRG